MNSNSKYLFILVFIAFFSTLKAQDAQFSQFYANKILLSPAFAGAEGIPQIALNGRMQWLGFQNTGVYRTVAAGLNTPIFRCSQKHGFGVSILNDASGSAPVMVGNGLKGEGSLVKTNVMFQYAYALLSQNKKQQLRLGLGAGFQQARITDQLVFASELVGNAPPSPDLYMNANRLNPHISAGAIFLTERMWLGATAFNLLPQNEVFVDDNISNDLPMRYAFFGGLNIPVGREKLINVGGRQEKLARANFLPAFMLRQQGFYRSFDFGLYFNSNLNFFADQSNVLPVTLGLMYRLQDAFIFSAGIRLGNIGIGYSYDLTISKLHNLNSTGTHEISLIYNIIRNNDRTRCPSVKMACPFH